MASNYSRGRAFEYRTRDKLLKMGAVYVMRAAQSKGAADLLALWSPDWWRTAEAPVWAIQCKRGTGRLAPTERDTLLDLAERTGAVPVLAKTGANGRGVVFTDLRTGEPIV